MTEIISADTATSQPRRTTRQRTMIENLLSGLDEFVTAQHIHEMLEKSGSKIGIATVYRNLQTMAADGALDVLHVDGEAMYRACAAQKHHHHIVCRECGKAVEIEIPGFEQWVRTHASRHGYTDVNHTVEIFGLCPDCSAKAAVENRVSGADPRADDKSQQPLS